MSSIQTDRSPSGDDLSKSDQRILAIDALRGFDMFWIVGGRARVRQTPTVHRRSTGRWPETDS